MSAVTESAATLGVSASVGSTRRVGIYFPRSELDRVRAAYKVDLDSGHPRAELGTLSTWCRLVVAEFCARPVDDRARFALPPAGPGRKTWVNLPIALTPAELELVDQCVDEDWTRASLKRSRSRFVRASLAAAVAEIEARVGGLPDTPVKLPRQTRVY